MGKQPRLGLDYTQGVGGIVKSGDPEAVGLFRVGGVNEGGKGEEYCLIFFDRGIVESLNFHANDLIYRVFDGAEGGCIG